MPHPRKYHRVAPDVREQIIRRIKDEGIPVQQVAAEHGVSPKTVWGWLGKGVTGQPTVGELVKLKRENQMLLALVGELTVKLTTAQKRG
jgi:transposase-like protein